MNLVLRDLREFRDLPQSGSDILFGRCISPVRCHYSDPGHQRPHLTQNTHAAMCPLRKVYGFLTGEKPFNEAVDFLTPGQSQGGTAIKRGGNPGADKTEWRAPFLVPGKTVPQPDDECADQLIGGLHGVELW